MRTMSAKRGNPQAPKRATAPPAAEASPSEIVQQLEPFVPPDRMGEAVQVVSMLIAQSHSGPLPAPRDFANYDRALPGAAERILAMAENEQTHRHGIEDNLVARELGFKVRGQLFAFIGLLVMLGAVLAMSVMGHATAGASLGGAVIIGVVALFLGQRWTPGRGGGKSPPFAEIDKDHPRES